jgi:hypothetical protein
VPSSSTDGEDDTSRPIAPVKQLTLAAAQSTEGVGEHYRRRTLRTFDHRHLHEAAEPRHGKLQLGTKRSSSNQKFLMSTDRDLGSTSAS